MNRKLLLLLASSVLSTAVLINGSVVNAKLNVRPSNGAIIEQSFHDYSDDLKEITESKAAPILKLIQSVSLYGNNGNFTEAEEYFESLLGELVMLKNSDEIQFNRYMKLCIDEFVKMSENNTTSPCPKYYLFKMMELTDNYDLAFSAIRKCISLDKNNPVYQYELANLYCETNQYEKAIKIYEQLKMQYPREEEFRVALASAYEKIGSYSDAVREYRVATAFNPEDSDTVAALVNASTYAKLAKTNSFYDPMKSVNAANKVSPQNTITATNTSGKQDVVAFGSSTSQSFSSSQAYSTELKDATGHNLKVKPVKSTSTPSTTYSTATAANNYTVGMQNVRQAENVKPKQYQTSNLPATNISTRSIPASNYATSGYTTSNYTTSDYTTSNVPASNITTSSNNISSSNIQNTELKNKRPRSSSSSSSSNSNKRIMVSYVNGRKVVKIVNVSQDNDISKTLTNSANSVTQQLINANNSSYDDSYSSPAQKSSQGQYSFSSGNSNAYTDKESDVFSSNDSYSSSKYNFNEKDYYSNSAGTNQTPINITAPQTTSPNVYVTNKTGNKAVNEANAKADKEKKKKDKSSAKKSSSTVNKTSGDNTDLYLKANELMAQNQYQQVIDILSQINPPTLRSLTSIASCYNALGNSSAALDYYNQADKISPNNSQILFSLAYIYFSKNDIETAKKYVNRSLQADPNNANAIQLRNYISQQDSNEDMNKAVSYMNSGNYADSKKILEKLAQTDSSNFQVYYYLGHICYATQKYADAVQDFLKAIKLNSEYSLSYYSLGLAYDKLKKFNDSLASYEKFIQMSTDDNKYTQYAKTRINTIKAKK